MKELIASEGKWLTQANLENEEERIFARRLYPAVSLTEADFTEWTDAQKAEWEEEHKPEEDAEGV